MRGELVTEIADSDAVYVYAVTRNERCEANDFCIIHSGDTAYALVSTRFGARTVYCKRHWQELTASAEAGTP